MRAIVESARSSKISKWRTFWSKCFGHFINLCTTYQPNLERTRKLFKNLDQIFFRKNRSIDLATFKILLFRFNFSLGILRIQFWLSSFKLVPLSYDCLAEFKFAKHSLALSRAGEKESLMKIGRFMIIANG